MIGNLVKKPNKVIGIDCSTKSLAYSRFIDGEFDRCGQVFFGGSNLWERLSYAHDVIPPMVRAGILDADLIVFERAFMGKSADVGLSLAYCYGAVIGSLMSNGTSVAMVRPLEWQSYIGNPNLTPSEKAGIKKDFPGKSKSWYSNKGREIRKQRTLDWARQYARIDTDSFDASDSVGIAFYGARNYHRLEYRR